MGPASDGRACRDCAWSAAVRNVAGELVTGMVDCHRRPVFEYRWPTDWCWKFSRRADGVPMPVVEGDVRVAAKGGAT